MSYIKNPLCLRVEGMHSIVGALALISILKCSSINIEAA